MIVFGRKFYAAVTSATVVATLALGIFAGFNVAAHASTQTDQVATGSTQVAGYNDGWLDAEANLADELGHRMPSKVEVQELVTARRQMGTSCHLEWDGPKVNQYEAICAPKINTVCLKVSLKDRAACVSLYSRPASTVKNQDGSIISNPAGPALVAECLSQYKGSELSACLRQPAL